MCSDCLPQQRLRPTRRFAGGWFCGLGIMYFHCWLRFYCCQLSSLLGVKQITMNIRVATTDTEINDCYPVMQELRPHIAEGQFLSRVRSQENAGYRLVYVQTLNSVVAVAGFRIGENLAWGRFLYVDDLVTLSEQRSKGYGADLLSWLKDEAAKKGCEQIHLDSGIQRKEAHRFYEREGMSVASFHFAEKVTPKRTRLDCEREANRNLKRWLDKPDLERR